MAAMYSSLICDKMAEVATFDSIHSKINRGIIGGFWPIFWPIFRRTNCAVEILATKRSLADGIHLQVTLFELFTSNNLDSWPIVWPILPSEPARQ
jgi:hypothetical protein